MFTSALSDFMRGYYPRQRLLERHRALLGFIPSLSGYNRQERRQAGNVLLNLGTELQQCQTVESQVADQFRHGNASWADIRTARRATALSFKRYREAQELVNRFG